MLGVIGLGKIGKEVAKRAVALEMKVLGYDPFVSNETIPKLNVKLVENLEEIYHRPAILFVNESGNVKNLRVLRFPEKC